jgi:EXLDI family protein
MNTTQDTPTLKLYTLRRDDLPPLRFRGEIIDEASTHTHQTTRWVDVTVYRTQGGRYILRIRHRTQWQGESDTLRAWSLSRPADIRDYLREDLGHIPGEVSRMLSRLEELPDFRGIWMEEVE